MCPPHPTEPLLSWPRVYRCSSLLKLRADNQQVPRHRNSGTVHPSALPLAGRSCRRESLPRPRHLPAARSLEGLGPSCFRGLRSLANSEQLRGWRSGRAGWQSRARAKAQSENMARPAWGLGPGAGGLGPRAGRGTKTAATRGSARLHHRPKYRRYAQAAAAPMGTEPPCEGESAAACGRRGSARVPARQSHQQPPPAPAQSSKLSPACAETNFAALQLVQAHVHEAVAGT